MSEVEFAWRLRVNNERTGTPAPWIGITGFRGKTSTTEMTSEMLTACQGLDAPTAGNIASGDRHEPVSLRRNPQHDVLCVELSSFQLHFTDSLALDCAAITNIADDHLDWHGGREITPPTNPRCSTTPNAPSSTMRRTPKSANWRPRLRLPKDAARWDSRSRPLKPARSALKIGWIVDRSGVAGGAVGESVQTGRHHRFHASGRAGRLTVPASGGRCIDGIGVGAGTWR